MLECSQGNFYHNGNEPKPWASGTQTGLWGSQGTTVGLRLRHGGLSVWIKGQQVGMLCDGLENELTWATDLYGGRSVRISCVPPLALGRW